MSERVLTQDAESAASRRVIAASVYILPMAVAAIVAFAWLGTFPGGSGDEMWVLHRVHDIQEGERPINGMYFYLGSLHQYLVWPFVALWGGSELTARAVGALASMATVGLVASSLRRVVPDVLALAAGLLLATCPAFAMTSRYSAEIVMCPFFAAVALRAFVAAKESAGRPRLWWVGAGAASLGLMVYNHLSTLPGPAALALVGLFVLRGRALRDRTAWAAAGGFVVGLVPRIAGLLSYGFANLAADMSKGSGWPPGAGMKATAGPLGALADIPYVPWLLARCWDGDLPYRSWVGASALWVLPYPEIALVIVLVLRRRRKIAFSRFEWLAVAVLALTSLFSVLMAPRMSLRYFLIENYAIPVLFALLALPLLKLDAVARERRAVRWVLAGVIGLNVLYVGTNYFGTFLRKGGGVAVFRIGTRMVESSNFAIRGDQLYDAFLARGIHHVYACEGLVATLVLRDQKNQLELDDASLDHEPVPDSSAPHPASAIVFYNGPLWTMNPEDDRFDTHTLGDAVRRQGITYRYDPSFPALFRVYVAEARP